MKISAAFVLVAVCSVGIYFSMEKTKKAGDKLWIPVTFICFCMWLSNWKTWLCKLRL